MVVNLQSPCKSFGKEMGKFPRDARKLGRNWLMLVDRLT